MKVLSVASEFYPLIKTGGLADVAGALPGALRPLGIEMATLLPGYSQLMERIQRSEVVKHYDELFGGPADIWMAGHAGAKLFILDAPHLYDRPGNPYLDPSGKDWDDNLQRFAALALVASDFGQAMIAAFCPDLLHLHDWQAALASVYGKFRGGVKSLLTVHNMAFQGIFPADRFWALGLPPGAFSIGVMEYYGKLSFLKGGLTTAAAISTVSPTYAAEICTPAFGMGLDGVLSGRRSSLSGIVNGIDVTIWNPATDRALAHNFGASNLAARAGNKRELEKRFGLRENDSILHSVISRLTGQKGLDVLAGEVDWLVASGARLVVLGTGEPEIEKAFKAASMRHKGLVAMSPAYDENLSHLIQGGADTMLVPSRFEPCGLTQLYALRYGCVPVVARTGGLADTVIDANAAALNSRVATGIHLRAVTAPDLQAALTRANDLFQDKDVWTSLQVNGMNQDVSWHASAIRYADLYRSIRAAQ